MGYSKIHGNLKSRIGSEVRFSTPKDIKDKGGKPVIGIIVDEVWVNPDINSSPPRYSKNNNDWGDYSFCSQLIKWGDKEYSIRLAYYRRRVGEDHWEFASQMTVNSDCKTIKTLLEKTLQNKDWFSENPEPSIKTINQ